MSLALLLGLLPALAVSAEAAHVHDFTYTAEGSILTAACGSEGCDLEDSRAALTIVAPALTVYGGSESPEATVTGAIPGVETPAVEYVRLNETLDAAPTDAGEYTAQITLGEGDAAATAYVVYTIGKAAQEAPEAPEVETVTADSVTLAGTEGCEYSCGGEVWQESPAFTGLTPLTEYSFYQRVKEDDNQSASPTSEPTVQKTASEHFVALTEETAPVVTIEGGSNPPRIGDTLTAATDATDVEWIWFRYQETETGESYKRIMDGDTSYSAQTYTAGAEDVGWSIRALAIQTKDAFGEDLPEDQQPSVISEPTAAVVKRPGAEAVPVAEEDFVMILGNSVSINGVEGQEYLIVPKGAVPTDEDWKGRYVRSAVEGFETSFYSLPNGDELTPITEYDIYTRTEETEECAPGAAVCTGVMTILTETGVGSDGFFTGLVGETYTVCTDPEEGVTFQWYASEEGAEFGEIPEGLTAIEGADGKDYVFSAEQLGKHITVKVFANGKEVGAMYAGCVTYGAVTFDTMGGSEIAPLTNLAYGDALVRPEDPTRDGYDFAGWYEDEEYEYEFSFEGAVMEFADTRLFAKWTEAEEEDWYEEEDDWYEEEPMTDPVPGEEEPGNEADGPAACPRDDACPVRAFPDADAEEWYHDGVHFMLERGLMRGFEDGSFGPGVNVSRAMLVTILYRLEGEPMIRSGMPFTDVTEADWYAMAVSWAESQGLVSGYGDGRFGPNDDVTREQLVTVLHRYALFKGADVSVGEDTNILSYDDAFFVSPWAVGAMQWACGSGLVQGRTEHTLDPKESASRADIAMIVMRLCADIAG